MFKHILLPTDGSALSQATIDKGIHFAKDIHARITGLCVVPRDYSSIFEAEIPGAFREQALTELTAKAKLYLAALEKAAKDAGVVCNVVLKIEEAPYEAIIDVAGKNGCDLIMMASHGRSGMGALLLGSVTQKVLTHSKIPVLVYR